MSIEIIVPRDATQKPPRLIHSAAGAEIAQSIGQTTTRRASEVEPTEELSKDALLWLLGSHPDREAWLRELPQAWWADMSRSTGRLGPVLGPFDTREAALAAEVEWLRERNLPLREESQQAPAEPA